MSFAAYPPEYNSIQLSVGPGPVPMIAAANVYEAIAAALQGSATGIEGQISEMASTWRGESAIKALHAFRLHNVWMRSAAAAASHLAAQSLAQAQAYIAARAMMPSIEVIVANRMALAAYVATNTMGQNTPLIAANELTYAGLWAMAAAAMDTYAATTAAINVGHLPPPTAPNIVQGTSGRGMLPLDPPADPVGGSSTLGATSNPVTRTPEVGQSLSEVGNSAPHVENASSEVARAAGDLPWNSEPIGSASDGATPWTHDLPEQTGFLGTNPYSPMLAALQGGAGSSVALGLTRGGLNAMSGASTGFRMPAKWHLGMGGGAAFGAPLANQLPAPVTRTAPPRGVSAPRSTQRRGSGREEDPAKSKAFTPNYLSDVPTLGARPILAVIDGNDRETRDDGRMDWSAINRATTI
ncbi:PPE family protein [Nocardia sp. NPDC050793]|uniref:PPE family protein n=1 Tax=Nocardia sp. NPDC050793 TaxID=3155159 RepID=UPI0033F69189